jgi:type III secretion system YscQ/HrcQ family protein
MCAQSSLIPTPIAANRFPRVSVSTADAVRDLASRRHLLLEPREILVSPFGRIVLRCVDTGAPSAYRKDCEAWGIVRARGSERPGTLVVDSLAALRLANTALGLPPPRVARILGHTERGVVAAILAVVVRQFSDELALSLRRPSRARDDLARITVALEAGRYREHVHLHVPPQWLPLHRELDIATEAVQRGLELTFQVLLARTELTVGDWSAAEVGDAVLFEGTTFPDRSQPLVVQLSCGSHHAEACLFRDGSLSIASPFENHLSTAIAQTRPLVPTPGRDHMPTSPEHRASPAEALLAAAPIEVVAEIGRLTLPAAEVLTLGPGSVLPLGWVRPESVDLRVGDRTWARGELVDLDGQLGVRLTSVAVAPPPEPHPPGDTQPIR